MQISSQFNKFLHGRILADVYRKTNGIIFYELKDTRTNDYFCIVKGVDYSDVDDLKQLFKLLNLNYAVDGDKKQSTKDIEVKPLLEHIEFILKVCAENDIELDMVKEDFERMIKQYDT